MDKSWRLWWMDREGKPQGGLEVNGDTLTNCAIKLAELPVGKSDAMLAVGPAGRLRKRLRAEGQGS